MSLTVGKRCRRGFKLALLLTIVGLSLFLAVTVWGRLLFTLISEQQTEAWDRSTAKLYESTYAEKLSERQYGEIIAHLQGTTCELHRLRYRGIYYIANTCGGLVEERE